MEDKIVEEFDEIMTELEDNFLNNSLIQDNKILIPMGNKLMRVRMPEQWEQSRAEDARNTKQVEILASGKCATKAKLIKMLKESEVADIEELENQKAKLLDKLQSVWVNLATRHSTETKSIDDFKCEDAILKDEIKKIALTISTHLIPSLETQLEKAYMECITSLCTENCVKDNVWERKWETFEDYQRENPIITDTALTYMTWLLLNTRG